MKENRAYWIGGTLVGLAGVGLVRLVAPELAGTSSLVAALAGYTLVIAGLTILAWATKRNKRDLFVTVETDPKK